MSNKQPFYHGAIINFTCDREVSKEEFEKFMEKMLSKKLEGYQDFTFNIDEYNEPEAGDPCDLM